MRRNHVAVRTCVGCRTRRPKAEMVRFVVGNGALVLGNTDGRGAYLCRAESCLEKALKRRNFRNLSDEKAAMDMLAGLRRAVSDAEPGLRGSQRASRGASGGGAIG